MRISHVETDCKKWEKMYRRITDCLRTNVDDKVDSVDFKMARWAVGGYVRSSGWTGYKMT